HELRVHPLRGELPAAAGVRALPYAAARDRDRDLLAIEADRVDARLVVAAAEPLRALFAVPQRAQQRPALAPVGGMKEPAGNGAGPEILARAFERPDLQQLPRHLVIGSFGLAGIGGRGDFAPGFAAVVRAVQLHSEVAEVQRGVNGLGVREDRAHRIAEEVRFADPPIASIDDEQAFARSDVELIHGYPPVSACSTWIALSPRTASPRPARRPSTKTKTCFLSSPCSSST